MRRSVSLAVLLLTGCDGLTGEPAREDVAWATAPDRRIHAILSETNGGATTSYAYVVELHAAGHRGDAPIRAGSLYGAVRSLCAYGVDLHWSDPSTLELRFESAKRVDVPPSVIVDGRRIRIVARDGQVNAAAPCGGMAANRPDVVGG